MRGAGPPGTAMRSAAGPPPSTAYMRMGTAAGRPGTGQQGGPGGPRTGTQVQVENRPITQHGVLGMKMAAGAGGGRKVLDKNYFMNELRQKRMEIANVTQKMRVRAVEERATRLCSGVCLCVRVDWPVRMCTSVCDCVCVW